MIRLVNADKYMSRLQSEIDTEADIIATQIKEGIPMATVKDCGRIGRLQGLQWCKKVLELDCYTAEGISVSDYEARLNADMVSTLETIRDELIQSIQNGTLKIESGNEELFRIIDKYKVESEENE